jgi:hypothetical protein
VNTAPDRKIAHANYPLIFRLFGDRIKNAFWHIQQSDQIFKAIMHFFYFGSGKMFWQDFWHFLAKKCEFCHLNNGQNYN